MKLSVGFSPCPNDTFIFDALVNGRIDTGGLEFEYFLADVEELNRKAFSSEADITKISSHAYAYCAPQYRILDSGSALGFGNGPLVISRNDFDPEKLNESLIAIPGIRTTANLLFSIAWPGALNKREYLFSDIENALIKGDVDAGLIIHETRFTYQKKGLVLIADLGKFWEDFTGLPIPLGMIVINRRIPEEVALTVNRILRQSVEFALKDSLASYDFVASHAREMDSDVMNSHIRLFVNDFSVNLGPEGKKAIKELFRIASSKRIIPVVADDIFLT